MIKPLGKNILVEPEVTASKSQGGIDLPEAWKQPSGEALVLAVGNALPNWARGIKVGDKVVYKWINGQEVIFAGRKLRLLEADHILGTL